MTHRTFIAVILAAALAVTGMTGTQARAGNDDVAKWIAGAVAIGIIGAVIAEEKKRDRRRDQVVTRQQSHVYGGHGQKKAYGHGGNQHKHAKQDRRRLLPSSCEFRLRTQRGDYRGYGQRCLLQNYAHYNSLPHQCAYRPKGGQGRVIYGQDCLHKHGYRTAAY